MSDITLYGYATSPFVQKVGCYLYYKKVPFTFTAVNPMHSREIEFTNQRQVPVLKIGDEWRLESTDLGIWLEELNPGAPILGNNEEERSKILAIDKWITDNYITSVFRTTLDTEMSLNFRHVCWRLAAIVSSQTPLPEDVRNAWPDLLRKTPFIENMMDGVNRNESLSDMFTRLAKEFYLHLDGGPYLGGLDQPSLADLSMFPQIVSGYMTGLEDKVAATEIPGVRDWILRVAEHLPENPVLAPDFMIVNKLDKI